HLAADAADPDDGQRLARDLARLEGRSLELAGRSLRERSGEILAQRERHRDRPFGDRQGAAGAAAAGDRDAGVPEIASDQIRDAGRNLVHEAEVRGAGDDAGWEGEGDTDDVRRAEQRVTPGALLRRV